MISPWRPAGSRELRVGLAGLGSMGRNHLRILAARDDIRLAAVADPVEAVLAGATAQAGAQGFAEPLAMIGEADRRRGSRRRSAGPGRSRRAVQPRCPRARPADRRRLALHDLLDRLASG